MAKNKTEIKAEPGKQELYIIREFDAPRELVFKAYTDAKLIAQWQGPKGYEIDVKKFEPQNGGSWSFVHKDQNGNAYSFRGVYHEVSAPDLIIQTFEFQGLPEKGHVTLETLRLEELPGGRTRSIGQSIFQSVGDRDGMIQSGMETGVVEGFERLDKVLENLK